jgi:hypothetical protein
MDCAEAKSLVFHLHLLLHCGLGVYIIFHAVQS